MNTVYLSLGSSLGDRSSNLSNARKNIENMLGRIVLQSAIYETLPWGFTDERLFFNQCLKVETGLGPDEVLSTILRIESMMGRIREKKEYEARLIDIDILFYNREILEKEGLRIPHPLFEQRKFVLVPMEELASGFIHPVRGKSIKELLDICQDTLSVSKI